MKAKQAGFTLVEIAIVLVIIGLLLGGVLKGQELITQAKIKNVANDFNGISAATYAYQDRYRAYPGEDQKAGRWPTATVSAAAAGTPPVGGGNGIVDHLLGDPTPKETWLFWQHLRLAGLITGNPDEGPPRNALGGQIGVQTNAPQLAGLVVCATGLPGKVANAIDSQFDDGVPNKGQVQGYEEGVVAITADPSAANGSGAQYKDVAAVTYTICKPM